MKKIILLLLLLGINAQAATVTRGYTFTTNEQITNTKLHTLVDSATVGAINSSDITDGTISLNDMGANSVDTTKIVAGTIVSANIATRSLLGTELATNSISGIELNTNQVIRSGFWFFTNATTFLSFTNSIVGFSTNQIASGMVNGTSSSAGAGDANKVVRLNGSGLIDSTMTPFSASFTSTNCAITAAGLLTQAHGLGAMPALVQIRAIELNGAGSSGYAVNDELIMPFGATQSADNTGCLVIPDATSINVRFGSAAQVFYILNKGTGAVTSMTPGDWKLIIRAWK